jgi:uncharacterized protein YeaO (DUF488 family)
MLKQATVSDLITGRVSRDDAYVVITMRRYPRFINRQLRDEYHTSMSPDPKLFEDWLGAKRRYQDHDGAFAKSRFEERFAIDQAGMDNLARLCEMAKDRDVYLVCQCHEGRRCHREFLLLSARKVLKAKAEKPKNDYPAFEARLQGAGRSILLDTCAAPRTRKKPSPAKSRSSAPSRSSASPRARRRANGSSKDGSRSTAR